MRIKNHVPINSFAYSFASKTQAWSNSEMAYFRLEPSPWENRITFSDIQFFRNFSSGTTQKVGLHSLANRISQKRFIDDKQLARCFPLCEMSSVPPPPPTRGGREEKSPLIHQPLPSVLIRPNFTSKQTGCEKGPFIKKMIGKIKWNDKYLFGVLLLNIFWNLKNRQTLAFYDKIVVYSKICDVNEHLAGLPSSEPLLSGIQARGSPDFIS